MKAFRSVTIDWRGKAAAFRVLQALPAGRRLYYALQRHVTRTLPRNLNAYVDWPMEHARTFRQRFTGDLSRARLFEFGAGWDLFNSFVQYCYGINDQVVVDIERWARADQINHAIAYLRNHRPPGASRVPELFVPMAFEATLEHDYGIKYRAPLDARHTAFESGSIDLICTTSVLEHLPRSVLEAITRESHRICHDGSILSHVIDYTDHYAHSDPHITIYNFLRFSEQQWLRFNPAIHYQNRLRHFEYGEMFRASGFVVADESARISEAAAQLLQTVPLADRFRAMSAEQLTPMTGHWVLRKPAGG